MRIMIMILIFLLSRVDIVMLQMTLPTRIFSLSMTEKEILKKIVLRFLLIPPANFVCVHAIMTKMVISIFLFQDGLCRRHIPNRSAVLFIAMIQRTERFY